MPSLVARRYDTLQPVSIAIESGRVSRIDSAADNSSLPIIAPGFVDLQINGFGGIEFNDRELTLEKVRQVALSQDQFGVTAFLATCTTDSHDVLKHGLGTIAKAIREETQALDSNVLVQSGSLEDNLALFQLPSRILSILAFIFGLSGLLLASFGIYGVMAYVVT